MSNTHDRTRDHRGTQDISTITVNGIPLSVIFGVSSPLNPPFAVDPITPAVVKAQAKVTASNNYR